MLQDSHCSDTLALVYVNALESILPNQNFCGLKERWAIHTWREEELKLIKFLGCVIAETVKLHWLVEWKLLKLFRRRPAKLHAIFHSGDRNCLKNGHPTALRSCLIDHSLKKRLASEWILWKNFLLNFSILLHPLRHAENSDFVFVVLQETLDLVLIAIKKALHSFNQIFSFLKCLGHIDLDILHLRLYQDWELGDIYFHNILVLFKASS